MSHRAPRRLVTNSGSVSVEMVVLAPVLVLLMIFVVVLGRAGGASDQVRHAADEAARAASLVAQSRMHTVAQAVADADLARNGYNCASTAVAVVVENAVVGGSVTVTVSCVVNQQDTALLGAHTRTVTASSTEVIDRYRAG
jgi:Flp pilus assembly protein TadG